MSSRPGTPLPQQRKENLEPIKSGLGREVKININGLEQAANGLNGVNGANGV